MKHSLPLLSVIGLALFWNVSLCQVFPLVSTDELESLNVRLESVRYERRDAIRVTGVREEGLQLALVKGTALRNGTIEIDVAGKPLPGANPGARGFVGVAFRVNVSDSARYEWFYLRPTNARADDQLRRNHSTQYISIAGFQWDRLRKEHPGVYESYVDLVPSGVDENENCCQGRGRPFVCAG